MTKKELLKILDTASYSALVIASVLVLIFEFSATTVLLRLAVLLYAAAFLILAVLCSTKLIFIKKAYEEDGVLLVDKSKENKAWIIIRLMLGVICFAFAIVFLVML